MMATQAFKISHDTEASHRPTLYSATPLFGLLEVGVCIRNYSDVVAACNLQPQHRHSKHAFLQPQYFGFLYVKPDPLMSESRVCNALTSACKHSKASHLRFELSSSWHAWVGTCCTGYLNSKILLEMVCASVQSMIAAGQMSSYHPLRVCNLISP